MDSGQLQMRQQMPTSSVTSNPINSKPRREGPPRPPPILTMNGNDMPRSEAMSAQGPWSTPTSTPEARPRPATIHEGFSYCMGEGYDGLPAWDSSMTVQDTTPSDTMSSRPISVHQDFYPTTSMATSGPPVTSYPATSLMPTSSPWMQKPCEDSMELHIDTDVGNIGQAYTTDEAIPIIDLRYQPPMEGDNLPYDGHLNPRRMSGSSFTMSTSGALSDFPSYDDFSAALSDAPSLSDYPPPSNRNSLMSSTQLSPVASPRMTPQGRSELVRTQSRGRGASPSPRPTMRSAPYCVDTARNKRWSTGSYGNVQNRRPSPFVYHHPHEPFGPRMSSRHSSPTVQHAQLPLNYGNLQAVQQPTFYMPPNPGFPRHSMLLPSQLPSQAFHPADAHHFENPPPLLSHGLFRMLQSNADPHHLHGHYTDLSDPPDLFASLHEEQIPPPPEDMNPSDPDLVPHEQDLRFDGDLYTPKWVRGHGNKREGWCGICKPGRWLVLKNSAFWYDKSFTHGISAATGSPFQEPQETRRMDGNPDVWEGLCGSCNDWIALVSSKKKGTTWFRHAYKCHTHPKIKDAPKRRRESSHQRLAASNMAKPKTEPQTPLTPQTTPAMSLVSTPTPTPGQALTPHPQIHIQQPSMQPLAHHHFHHPHHAPPQSMSQSISQPMPPMIHLEATQHSQALVSPRLAISPMDSMGTNMI